MRTLKQLILTDEAIIEGLRQKDSSITRDYFYSYCRVAYNIYDRQYQLSHKPGLDFYSVAHEYYLYLDSHDFKPLQDKASTVSLKTWMVNGLRFMILDRLKAYNKEQTKKKEEDLDSPQGLRFDMVDSNIGEEIRNTVMEICQKELSRDSRESILLQMMLIDGFKGKDVALELHITPAAVSQRYQKLMHDVVIPYFKNYFEPTCVESIEESILPDYCGIESAPDMFTAIGGKTSHWSRERHKEETREHKNRRLRTTRPRVESLQPNEIFVFGSNLKGMHGGGTARTARLYFGAQLGVGEGPQGQSYAIPTMQGGIDSIRPYVQRFIKYAKEHPDRTFLVTPIGCGLAGFYPDEIAPLFKSAIEVDNIHLPASFWDELYK